MLFGEGMQACKTGVIVKILFYNFKYNQQTIRAKQ